MIQVSNAEGIEHETSNQNLVMIHIGAIVQILFKILRANNAIVKTSNRLPDSTFLRCFVLVWVSGMKWIQ